MRRVAPTLSRRPLAQLVSLGERVAVVTGGARGIGLAICGRLAEAGASVVVADLDAAAASAAAVRLEVAGRRAVGVPVDVADSASVSGLADEAFGRFGHLDIWVNNAGVYSDVQALDMTDDEWRSTLRVNLDGLFFGAREAARRMVGGGVICNLASTSAYRTDVPGLAAYVASKHAVRGLTKSLAVEFGPLGIRVVGVAPTVVRTPGLTAIKRSRGEDLVTEAAALGAALPLGRIAEPDDVARVVLFCVSDLAAMMTGTTVVVDGGDLAS